MTEVASRPARPPTTSSRRRRRGRRLRRPVRCGPASEGLDDRDRALARQLAFGSVQRMRTLDHAIETSGSARCASSSAGACGTAPRVVQLGYSAASPLRRGERVGRAGAPRGSRAGRAVHERSPAASLRGNRDALLELPEGPLKHSYPDWVLWRAPERRAMNPREVAPARRGRLRGPPPGRRGRRLRRPCAALRLGGPRRSRPGARTPAAFGSVQRLRTLDHAIETLGKRPVRKLDPPVLAALRLGAYQLGYLGGVPRYAAVNESVELVRRANLERAVPFTNAVLRRVSEGIATAPLRAAGGTAQALVSGLDLGRLAPRSRGGRSACADARPERATGDGCQARPRRDRGRAARTFPARGASTASTSRRSPRAGSGRRAAARSSPASSSARRRGSECSTSALRPAGRRRCSRATSRPSR